MNIKVNGDDREVELGITLRQLVEQFELVPEKVAIELNRRLVRSAAYDQEIHANDQIEIVTFVGGG